MKNKRILILSIITNIILIVFICNFINRDIIREKQIVKEMSESSQVTDLNNQINSLNTEHTEYMNYIQTCKTQLASTISNEGVPTSENDTFEKMVTNIGDIFTQRTKLDESVAATADNITEGKQAYVNGQLITGTGADNTASYEKGTLEGKKVVRIRTFNEDASIAGATVKQTVNVSSYEGYQNFTTNNFLLDCTSVFCGNTNSQMDRVWVGVNYQKSYNASTGVFTITTTEDHKEDTRGFTGYVYLIY